MPRFSRLQKRSEPVPVFLCRNRAEVTAALARIREHLGISQLELDEIAGFSTGYTGKMEQHGAPAQPGKRKSGRSAINPMFDIWLGSLKVGLVIVPLDGDPDVSRAVPSRDDPPAMTLKRAQRMRALHNGGKGRSKNTLYRMFRCTPKMVGDILEGRVFVTGAGAAPVIAPPKTECAHGHAWPENMARSRVGATMEFVEHCRLCRQSSQRKRDKRQAALAKDGQALGPRYQPG